MNLLLFSCLALALILGIKGAENAENAESVIPSKTEYERYLDQILLVFEKDPKVKEILKNATPQDIKNGVIEKTLRRLHPDIRSKLDEVKRNIIMEYRQKLRKAKMDDKVPDDLYKFQDEDLKHLLKERHDRLATMNEERKRQFKKYEMEKELKHRMALRAMNEYDRKVQEALDEEQKKKKVDHAKNIKHPGNKKQLEEVWEAEGFDKGSFNPKTFFKMHDVNNDGEWDDFELEAIFEKEVDELFEGLDDIDEEEKDEEVSRMREHVIEHIDKDDDGVIQLKEFIDYANSQDFDHEDPWDAAFSAEFSEEDLGNYERDMDEREKEDIKAQAEIEKQRRLETIKKYEDESKINMQMLKDHSEKLKEALLAANKAKDLEKAKKLVADAQVKEGVANASP